MYCALLRISAVASGGPNSASQVVLDPIDSAPQCMVTRGLNTINPIQNPIKSPFSYGFPRVSLWFWRMLETSPRALRWRFFISGVAISDLASGFQHGPGKLPMCRWSVMAFFFTLWFSTVMFNGYKVFFHFTSGNQPRMGTWWIIIKWVIRESLVTGMLLMHRIIITELFLSISSLIYLISHLPSG